MYMCVPAVCKYLIPPKHSIPRGVFIYIQYVSMLQARSDNYVFLQYALKI